MTPAQVGCLVRDHHIPSQTPAGTPRKRRRRREEQESESGGDEQAPDSDSTSSSEMDSSGVEETAPPRKSALKNAQRGAGKRQRADSEGETDVEDRSGHNKKSVRLDPRTELKAITPKGVETLHAAAVLFKEASRREAASFVLPEDWEDAEERDAYEGRAGRAIDRLKTMLAEEWPGQGRSRDMEELRELREEVMDKLLRIGAAAAPARQNLARALFAPSYGEASSIAAPEEKGGSGAAALSAEQQPGAVSADVAERL
ncbi:MAG: hypothetical protein SGPRY_002248, partial [Prymnesium sp.]